MPPKKLTFDEAVKLIMEKTGWSKDKAEEELEVATLSNDIDYEEIKDS